MGGPARKMRRDQALKRRIPITQLMEERKRYHMTKYPVTLKWNREADRDDLFVLFQLSNSMPMGEMSMTELNQWLPFGAEVKDLSEDAEKYDRSQPEWETEVQMTEEMIEKLIEHQNRPPERLRGAFLGRAFGHFKLNLLEVQDKIKKGEFGKEGEGEAEDKKPTKKPAKT